MFMFVFVLLFLFLFMFMFMFMHEEYLKNTDTSGRSAAATQHSTTQER